MSDVVSWDFEVTDTPPKTPQSKGGPGRKRSNPFDKPVWDSYDQKFAQSTAENPEGKWYRVSGRVEDPKEVAKLVIKIRNAARYLKIGSEVKVGTGDDEGIIAFRGVEPKKGPNAPQRTSDNETVQDEATGTVENAGSETDTDEYEQY